MLDEKQTPSLLTSPATALSLARLDLIQTLNGALNAMVCYVCIVWDVVD